MPACGLSVVVDAAVDVGGVEVTKHLEGRRGLGFLGVALLKVLQFLDLLLDLAGDRLLTVGLGLGQGGAIGLELVSDRGHGTQPQQGPNGPGECNPAASPGNTAHPAIARAPMPMPPRRSGAHASAPPSDLARENHHGQQQGHQHQLAQHHLHRGRGAAGAPGERSRSIGKSAARCRSTRAKRSITKRKSKVESSPSALHFRQVRPRQQPVLIGPLVFMADLLLASAPSLLGYGPNDCCRTAVNSCGGCGRGVAESAAPELANLAAEGDFTGACPVGRAVIQDAGCSVRGWGVLQRLSELMVGMIA